MSKTNSEDQTVDNELETYKAEILPVNKARLHLERDLYFIGTTQRGYEVEFDVKYEEGCSPTESLLLSVVGCLSIDIVHILLGEPRPFDLKFFPVSSPRRTGLVH